MKSNDIARFTIKDTVITAACKFDDANQGGYISVKTQATNDANVYLPKNLYEQLVTFWYDYAPDSEREPTVEQTIRKKLVGCHAIVLGEKMNKRFYYRIKRIIEHGHNHSKSKEFPITGISSRVSSRR